MIPCIWYVSKIAHPWERAMIGNMATALRARNVSVSLFVDGGTTDFCVDGILSWRALTGLERMRLVFSGGSLWHLWGTPPLWWGLVRVRSRTVHTSWAPSPAWRGHPSRLFTEQAGDGESVIKPTFESRLPQAEEPATERSEAAYLNWRDAPPNLRKAVTDLGCRIVDLRSERFNTASAKSGFFLSGGSPSDALLAAALTIQGLAVVGRDSSYLHSLLGGEGSFIVEEDEEGAWRQAMERALSDQGRARATSARHFIKTHYSAAESADTLEALYESVLEGNA